MKELGISMITALSLFCAVNWILDGVFRTGLEKYYCLYPADILIVGHSMSEMGIDRNALEDHSGMTVAKYCLNGAGAEDRLVMIKHYVEATGHKPKIVLYDVSARSFSDGLANNSYALFYPFINKSKTIEEYLRKNASHVDFLKKKVIPLCRYDDTRLGAVARGYRGNWQTMNFQKLDVSAFRVNIRNGIFWKINFNDRIMSCFDKTLDYLDREKVRCLLIALPCVDLLNEAEPEKYQRAIDFIKCEADKYPSVSFCDLNDHLSREYELFADPIHLNFAGQKVVTGRVAELLKKCIF